MASTERLHKFLASCGVASRRKSEEYILEGRVAVNGEVVDELGVKINPERDRVTFDGKVVNPERHAYYLMHKPRGYATTAADERGRKTALDLLEDKVHERVYPAGRLDLESEGLLFLTNDGDATFYLTHPSCGIKKVYEATVEGSVSDETLKELVVKGVRLGPVLIKPLFAKLIRRRKENSVVKIMVAEGVNREVRRLFAALGHEVKRLVRLEIGPFKLTGIARGKYRKLNAREYKALREGMEKCENISVATPARSRKKTRGRPPRRGAPTGKPDPAEAVSRRGKKQHTKRKGKGSAVKSGAFKNAQKGTSVKTVKKKTRKKKQAKSSGTKHPLS